jgi:hypothetical protein
MLEATGGKLGPDVSGLSGHVLDSGAWRGRWEGTRAQHENRLFSVGPPFERQHGLERLAAYDQRVHRGHEFMVAVRFATASLKKVEVAVGSRDESVEARPNRHGCFHPHSPVLDRTALFALPRL